MSDPTRNGSTSDLVINRAQRRVLGHINLDDTRYTLRTPPGSVYQKIQAAGPHPTIEQTWEAVQSLLPDLPPDVLHDLALEELRDIVTYAMDPARAVEQRAAAAAERP